MIPQGIRSTATSPEGAPFTTGPAQAPPGQRGQALTLKEVFLPLPSAAVQVM